MKTPLTDAMQRQLERILNGLKAVPGEEARRHEVNLQDRMDVLLKAEASRQLAGEVLHEERKGRLNGAAVVGSVLAMLEARGHLDVVPRSLGRSRKQIERYREVILGKAKTLGGEMAWMAAEAERAVSADARRPEEERVLKAELTKAENLSSDAAHQLRAGMQLGMGFIRLHAAEDSIARELIKRPSRAPANDPSSPEEVVPKEPAA